MALYMRDVNMMYELIRSYAKCFTALPLARGQEIVSISPHCYLHIIKEYYKVSSLPPARGQGFVKCISHLCLLP